MPAKKIYRKGERVGTTNSTRRYLLCNFDGYGKLRILKRSDDLTTIRKEANTRRGRGPTGDMFGYDLVTEMELVNI